MISNDNQASIAIYPLTNLMTNKNKDSVTCFMQI